MTEVDLVLQFVSRHEGDEAMRVLVGSAVYSAFRAATDPGLTLEAAPAALAALPEGLRPHALALKIWRLAADMERGPPPLDVRGNLAPDRQQPRNGVALSAPHARASYCGAPGGWQGAYAAHQLKAMADELGAPPEVPMVAVNGATGLGTTSDPLQRLAYAMERQEELLAWLVLQYGALVPTPAQVVPTLESLLPKSRTPLGRLPVFLHELGAAVKGGGDRSRAWQVYRAFHPLYVPLKIYRWVIRNRETATQASFASYLAKSTIVDIQMAKAACLPWSDWVFGSKAAQAAELAAWLWWQKGEVGELLTERDANRRAHFYPYY